MQAINRIAVALLTVLIIANCGNKNTEDYTRKGVVLVPFFSKILYYVPETSKIGEMLRTDYLLFRKFTLRNRTYFIGKKDSLQSVLLLTNSQLVPVFSGSYMEIFLLSDYVLTCSAEHTPGKGFLWTIHPGSILEGGSPNPVKTFELDLFVSDFFQTNNRIILCGSDDRAKTNKSVLVDAQSGGHIALITEEKHHDFFKVFCASNLILIYNSSTPQQYTQERLWTLKLTNDASNQFILTSSEPKLPQDKMNFYGKGFYYDRTYYFPLIDENFNAYLLRTHDLSLTNTQFIPISSGFYQMLTVDSNILQFIGYNYYVDSGKFYSIRADLLFGKEVWVKALY